MRCGFLTAPPPANEATPKWLRSKGQGVEALLARDDILDQEGSIPLRHKDVILPRERADFKNSLTYAQQDDLYEVSPALDNHKSN